jgi:hypothetical protein
MREPCNTVANHSACATEMSDRFRSFEIVHITIPKTHPNTAIQTTPPSTRRDRPMSRRRPLEAVSPLGISWGPSWAASAGMAGKTPDRAETLRRAAVKNILLVGMTKTSCRGGRDRMTSGIVSHERRQSSPVPLHRDPRRVPASFPLAMYAYARKTVVSCISSTPSVAITPICLPAWAVRSAGPDLPQRQIFRRVLDSGGAR